MFKPLALVAGLASASLALVMSQTAFAAVDPYTGLGQGWDISYPQCPGGGYVPNQNTANFGIAGIDHGRPFDVDNQYNPNPCLAEEYGQAPAGQASLYMNTGYANTYYKNHQVADCVTQSKKINVKSTLQQAWEIGCAFAYFNEQYALGTGPIGTQAAGLGLPDPKMWWLDVETGNSWSSSNKALNAETLDGATAELAQLKPGIPVGVYSTPSMWTTIVGANQVSGLTADWLATGQTTALSSSQLTADCTATGFAGQQVWLVQWVWQSTYDYDQAC
jgi:hypothetical protein